MSYHTARKLIDITCEERLRRRSPAFWNGEEADFERIALEFTYLERLADQGWWGDFSYCMYAETILRCFGDVIADAALTETTRCDKADVDLFFHRMVEFLDWFEAMHNDHEELHQSIIAARQALVVMLDHFKDLTWDKYLAERAAAE